MPYFNTNHRAHVFDSVGVSNRKSVLFQSNLLAGRLGMSKNAFSAGGEKISELVVLKAGEPDQHHGVLGVVIRDVVCLRIIADECRSLLKIGAYNKRPW